MVQVKTEKARSLLRLTYAKHVSMRQVKQCLVEVEAALRKLQPGFRVLTDLSGLEEMDYACATEIQVIMDLCRKKGVSKVVRVIPDSRKDIGFTVMSFFHLGQAVPILTCETMKEANEKLNWSVSEAQVNNMIHPLTSSPFGTTLCNHRRKASHGNKD